MRLLDGMENQAWFSILNRPARTLCAPMHLQTVKNYQDICIITDGSQKLEAQVFDVVEQTRSILSYFYGRLVPASLLCIRRLNHAKKNFEINGE